MTKKTRKKRKDTDKKNYQNFFDDSFIWKRQFWLEKLIFNGKNNEK